MLRSLIQDDNAVNITIGHILNLVVLMIVTGTIVGAFYPRIEDSSQQAMRAGFADLGSEIARDITNMYFVSANSHNNVSFNVTRNIPLTIGGKGYRIELKNASESGNVASIYIKEAGFFSSYETITNINSINSNVSVICRRNNETVAPVIYSGSGEMRINMTKNNTGALELCIK